MKVNELMIGDLVIASVHLCLDEDWNETKIEIPCRIEGISENGDIGEGWNFSCTPIRKKDAMEYDNFEDIEPIPLTPEILKLNALNLGRNSIEEDTFIHIDFMEIFINNFTPNKLVRVLINHKECFCYEGLHLYLKFQYVHELQHALRLCGLNEFADNFKVV